MNTIAQSPRPLSQYENALIQYLKKSGTSCSSHACQPRLEDLHAIWGWRCGVEPQYVRLTDLAESFYVLCERLDLLGQSFSNFPGGPGGFGVIADAAPERDWTINLAGRPGPGASGESHYWFRIVAVLCSRLRMSEVAKLPGYKHGATAGPFKGEGAQLS